MNIATIAQRVGVPLRKVRYVLDQRLLPGVRRRQYEDLPGQPRAFTDDEGYFIACAALLLHGGVQRRTIVEALTRLSEMPWPLPGERAPASPPGQPVVAARWTAMHFMGGAVGEPAELWIGDGVNLRLFLQGGDTGWIEPRTQAPLASCYRPWVIIRLDLAWVKKAILARPRA